MGHVASSVEIGLLGSGWGGSYKFLAFGGRIRMRFILHLIVCALISIENGEPEVNFI